MIQSSSSHHQLIQHLRFLLVPVLQVRVGPYKAIWYVYGKNGILLLSNAMYVTCINIRIYIRCLYMMILHNFFYTLSKTVIFNVIITRCRCLYPSFCDPTNLVVHLQIRSAPADGSPEKGGSKSSKVDCPTSKKKNWQKWLTNQHIESGPKSATPLWKCNFPAVQSEQDYYFWSDISWRSFKGEPENLYTKPKISFLLRAINLQNWVRFINSSHASARTLTLSIMFSTTTYPKWLRYS